MAAPEETKTPPIRRLGMDTGLRSGRRQDFTYRRFQGIRVKGLDLGRSLFIGALFEDCAFVNVDFSRSDFSGTKLVRCTLEGCRLSTVEIRSCRLDAVQLVRCDLQTAQISRSDCRETTFLSCNLQETTLHEDTFVDCRIADCRFERASITSVEFDRCSLTDTGLANCTALFLFFYHCSFDHFVLNAETIGLTYGLNRRDLERIELVHLGDGQEKPKDMDLVDLLLLSYQVRRWYVGAAAIEMNFGLAPTVVVARRLARNLSELAKEGLPCDLDEMDFFIRVLERLEKEGQLPLLAGRDIGRALRGFHTQSVSGYDDRLIRLIARIDRVALALLDEVGDFARGGGKKLVRVEFHLKTRPPRPLDSLCGDIIAQLHGPIQLEFVSGSEGSWTEIWQTIPSVVGTIQIIFLSVSGSLAVADTAVRRWRRLVKTIKREQQSKEKGMSKSIKILAPLIAADDQLALEIASARRRADAISDDVLRLVDKTLVAVEAKPEQDLINLQAYAGENVMAVTVRPVRMPAKRGPRRKAPAV